MSWILIIVGAYFLLAVANFGDKILIDNVLGDSKVYAFLISVLGVSVILAGPWFLLWPGIFWLIINIGTGILFPFALYYMFEALKRGDASRMTVLIGGIIPVFTIILSYLFFQERLALNQWLGIGLLLIGTFLIATITSNTTKKSRRALWFCLYSAIFYAVFFIGTKYAYNHQDFFSSFIWIRLGGLVGALLFLIRRSDRQSILKSFSKHKQGAKTASLVKTPAANNFVIKSEAGRRWLVLGNQGVGALGSVLQSYAISLGSVALINAMQGVQYAFLLIFGWLLTIFQPRLVKEDIKTNVISKKIIAIILITIGLYFIVR